MKLLKILAVGSIKLNQNFLFEALQNLVWRRQLFFRFKMNYKLLQYNNAVKYIKKNLPSYLWKFTKGWKDLSILFHKINIDLIENILALQNEPNYFFIYFYIFLHMSTLGTQINTNCEPIFMLLSSYSF